VDLALAGALWSAGDAAGSLAAVDSVLAYQSDSPEGLWLKASALALAGRNADAFAAYDQAVRLRTGVVELRNDYARDLLRAGRTAEARKQLEEAHTLDPEDPVAEALRGWADLADGNRAGARTHLQQAIQWAPWCDLATILLGRVQQLEGDGAAAGQTWAPILARLSANAPPEYIYRAKQSAWRSVHDLPAVNATC
jgi:Flp pilus assembly protein TadD